MERLGMERVGMERNRVQKGVDERIGLQFFNQVQPV